MIGQTIGKYRVEERIGRGGMGTVYRAVDETLHREVALKVLNAELNDPEIARRFRAEAVTVARLSHPGIATIYELFQHDGQWLMVMEFVRGETLERLVTRSGPLQIQRAAEFCMQALAALSHAHGLGVVHRDLKPANLMINELGVVKVMDFGIARVSGSEHLTNAGFMMGTPAYMAPEQVMGSEVDSRADLYAMGVVLYRLSTGKLPFKGDTAFAMAQSQVNDPPTPVMLARPDLPPWVEMVVARALAKSPDSRFQTALEFQEALGRSIAGMPFEVLDDGESPTMSMATPTRTPLAMPTPGSAPTIGRSQPVTVPPAPAPGTSAQPRGPATKSTPGARPAAAAKPASTAAARKQPLNTIAAVVAAVVLLIVLAFAGRWLIARRAQEPPPAAPPAAAPPVTETTPPPATTDPAAQTPPPSAPPAAEAPPAVTTAPPTQPPPAPAPTVTSPPKPQTTGSQTAVSRGASTPSARGSVAPGRVTTTPPPVPPPVATTPPDTGRAAAEPPPVPVETPKPAAAPAPAAADDSLVPFSNAKYLAVNGRRTSDRDIVLTFGNGHITISSRDGGGAILSIPYGQLRKATYVSARDPKWDAALPGPPADVDVGSVIRLSRHWLVLQTAETYAILRLDERTVPRFLDVLQTRTGVKVDRPAGAK